MNFTKNGGRAWAASLIITFACVGVYMTQNKYSPCVSEIREFFGIGLQQSSTMMSVFGLTAIICALFVGAIATKLGSKKTVMVGLGCMILGSCVGAVTSSYEVMIGSRVFEAIGRCVMLVCGPTMVALLFTKDKVGLPMGIQAAWTAIGGIIVLNIASLIVPAFGFKGMWWFTAIWDAAMLALVWFFVPNDDVIAKLTDEEMENEAKESKTEVVKVSILSVLKNPAVWLLGIIMAGYTITAGSVQTYGPSYLKQACGYGSTDANFLSSMLPTGKIIGSCAVGAVMYKFRNKPLLMMILLACVACLSYFIYQFTADTDKVFIVFYLLVTGALMCGIPATLNAMAPECINNKLATGTALGVIIFIQNLANTYYPGWITGIVESSGGQWSAASLPCLICTLIALASACGLFAMAKMRTKKNETEEKAA